MSRSTLFSVSLLSDGRWLVSGQKFDRNGNVIEDLDRNALYIYNPKTREFSDLVYQDPVYDVGGFTGGCRSGTPMSASVNEETGQLRSLTYAGAEPTTLYFMMNQIKLIMKLMKKMMKLNLHLDN